MNENSPDKPGNAATMPWRWLLLGAFLLPLLYLPSVATRFDFIDDGNLVYPAPPTSFAGHLHLLWNKVVANAEHLGPFRPVLWLHWSIEAQAFDGSETAWRLARLGWLALATAALLWLLRELRIPPAAALLTTALAMWNPYRNEIWTSLTLSEGVAMPYALAGLACAIRAARSPRSLPWDLLGAACVLAALGCKNTFAALVPAQLLLRIAPDGRAWLDGLRRHGWRAALLSLTLLLPIGHFVYFKTHWHPGQYASHGPTLRQGVRMLGALKGSLSLDFLAPGLALCLAALWLERAVVAASFARYRAAFVAGLALLGGGICVYLPMDAVSGRYSMPAVWGADLGLAGLLAMLGMVRLTWWRRGAMAGLIAGLVAVAIANVGKQDKFAARARLLWQTLEYVEREAPDGTRLGWMSRPEASVAGPAQASSNACLDVEEGVHFNWHLHARRRHDLLVGLCDEALRPTGRTELAPLPDGPTWLIGGDAHVPGSEWRLREAFAAPYWSGRRSFHCFLFEKISPPSQQN